MSALYIVNHASVLAGCVALAGPNDSILLIQDAVLAAATDHDRPVVALQEDLTSRAIEHIGRHVETTDYAGFVELTVRHQPIVSWR